MKPDLASLKSACPEVDERFLKEHRERLGDVYFSSFPKKETYRHVRSLAGLSSERPLEVTATSRRDGSVDITVLAFDYPFEFSIITGVLAGLGFSVLSGDIFTYGPAAAVPSAPGSRKGNRRQSRPGGKFIPRSAQKTSDHRSFYRPFGNDPLFQGLDVPAEGKTSGYYRAHGKRWGCRNR